MRSPAWIPAIAAGLLARTLFTWTPSFSSDNCRPKKPGRIMSRSAFLPKKLPRKFKQGAMVSPPAAGGRPAAKSLGWRWIVIQSREGELVLGEIELNAEP